MAGRGYIWRRLTEEQREEVLAERRERGRPWHSPPHWDVEGRARFHITAACYEHSPIIGVTGERMSQFSDDLLGECGQDSETHIYAWCVLPNHYHVLLQTGDISGLLTRIGRLHGRTSYGWNLEEEAKGRKVFYRAVETRMKSEGHFWATLNYVHHNPVRHGYVERWQEWPWSSAAAYLERVGRGEAERIWRDYPVGDYGEEWDRPEM
ncbi:MAG TPA: hypothetical protein VM008_09610 [Phycisphaerae bacterium]|nr:hypothetical protein [Phycisphaerae bacterium]